MNRFVRYELRTTDVAAARAFYESILTDGAPDVSLLPAQALARGARPHWLGHIGVADVSQVADAFVARGALRLGPPPAAGDTVAILRDPGGAVVALSRASDRPTRSDVDGHVLNTTDVNRAMATYAELLGWQAQDVVDLGAAGAYHRFAWQTGGGNAGGMADITHRPGVHAHWLFQFRVLALAPAVAKVQGAGGVALAPLTLANGDRIAVCDDPQGAAFALCETRGRVAAP